MLECEDFVEFLLELTDEALLVVFVPWTAFGTWIVGSGLSLEGSFQAGFEVVVGNVRVLIVTDQRCLQLATKAGGCMLAAVVEKGLAGRRKTCRILRRRRLMREPGRRSGQACRSSEC